MKTFDQTTPICALIKQYEKDITYDCHPVERRYNHSDARKEMQRRGPEVLGPIGAHLFSRFPIGGFHQLGESYWDHFLAWGYLLYGIIEDHTLSDKPYKGVPFGEQSMDTWISFCFRNAKPLES